MSFALGAFAGFDQQLTDAVMGQFAEKVTLQLTESDDFIELGAVVNRNVGSFSTYESEVVEPVVSFTFRFSESGAIPAEARILLGWVSEIDSISATSLWDAGLDLEDPAHLLYHVDRLDPTASPHAGKSEDDGSTIRVIARPL